MEGYPSNRCAYPSHLPRRPVAAAPWCWTHKVSACLESSHDWPPKRALYNPRTPYQHAAYGVTLARGLPINHCQTVPLFCMALKFDIALAFHLARVVRCMARKTHHTTTQNRFHRDKEHGGYFMMLVLFCFLSFCRCVQIHHRINSAPFEDSHSFIYLRLVTLSLKGE